ncbi:MAG: MATE family efflux transporter, partial [Chloroflexi bacterium]|nr:MATE family efflux transporter [Chloroflexota bacterium]
ISPNLFEILGAQGAGVDYNMSYITPIFQGALFFNLVFMFHAALSAQGETRPFRNFLALGFALNLILDPWFIYGGLGLPALGIAGVGVATSLIQALGSVYLGWRAARSGIFAGFRARWLLPDRSRIWQIIKQGAPPALDLSTVSVGGFVVTYFVSRFGSDAVAAYGIASRLDGLIWIPLVGLDVATLVLVAQNNGARRYDRMWTAYHTALRYGFALMIISGVVVFVFAYELVSIFTAEPAIIETGVVYIRISALSLWSKPLGFIGFAALRGIKKPLLPMVISMMRMIVLPALMLHALVSVLDGGLLSIWWTITGITVATGLFAGFCVQRLMPRAATIAAPPR